MNLKWWQYRWTDFDFRADIPIEKFIEIISGKVANGLIKPYIPKKLTGKMIIDASMQE